MPYQDLQVNQLAPLLQDQSVSILDMRDKNSYELEHLDGAKLVNDETVFQIVRRHNKNNPIIVYCYRGNSSRDLASFFSNQGFSRVFNLAGGWQAWKDFSETTALNPANNLKEWLEKNNFNPANINSRVDNGMTPLMLATVQGNEKLVEKILSCKPDVNLVNNDGNNGLWFACVNNNTRMIKLLIENGINIDNVNVNGATCLIYSSSAGKLDAVKCLVESGADLETKTLDSFSALDSAATYEILKYLKPRYLNH